MADTSHLFKRGNTWFVRVAIPRHLQDAIGTRLIRRSLQTHSLPEANRRKHAVIAEVRKLIAETERATGISAGTSSGTPVDHILADLRTLRRQRRLQLYSADEVDLLKDSILDRLLICV